MEPQSPVFEETYNDYLNRIAGIDLESVTARLGVTLQDDEAIIPFLGRNYRISKEGIFREDGSRPQMGTCVILSQYLLLCPEQEPVKNDWASYRDFKDSGPLANYFSNDVERTITKAFAGRMADLERSAERLGGYTPDADFPYDLCRCFDALPKIPLLLLFNDVDDEFPARCTVLFRANAEKHLDGECLAMLGAQLAGRLSMMLP
jgi:hypothetical protein